MNARPVMGLSAIKFERNEDSVEQRLGDPYQWAVLQRLTVARACASQTLKTSRQHGSGNRPKSTPQRTDDLASRQWLFSTSSAQIHRRSGQASQRRVCGALGVLPPCCRMSAIQPFCLCFLNGRCVKAGRATPTSNATSAGLFPLSSSRPARNRFFVASSDSLLTMPHTLKQFIEDITHRAPIGCHVLRKYQ
jgi:hypothetical protein